MEGASSTNSAGKTGHPHAKELNVILISHHIQNSKWIKDLDIWSEIMKLLGKT
jgi:hypothetical protein